jgi:hypothetical protein
MRTQIVCLALALAACSQKPTVENRAPSAVAPSDLAVFGGNAVTLTGSGTDPEGDTLSFAWSQTAGQTVTLTDASTAAAHFTAPEVTTATTLVFKLTVSDGRATASASTSVTINPPDPNNQVPVVNITAPTMVQAGATVTLDGSTTTDPDGDSLTFVWSQTAGTMVTLTNTDQAKTTFVAPAVTADTVFAFKLVASDAKGGQAYSQVSVTVQPMTGNRAPVANAGSNQNVAAAAVVTLTGAGTDPDGDAIASYKWTQTAGTAVTLSSSTVAAPTFTAPSPGVPVTLTFSLVVTDAKGLPSSPATVSVVVSNGAVTAATFTKVVSLHSVTRTGIVVFFLTDVAVKASVDYGTASTGENTFTETQPVTRHVISLSGLTADTKYVYAVRAGTASSSGSFSTAIDYAAAAKPFSFAVVGDARAHTVWKTVATAVLAKNPRFMIQTGDNNDSAGSATNWADYYSSAKDLFANVPVYAAQGNHDTGSNFSVYNLAPQSSSNSDLYYAFLYGNASFVAINTNGSSTAMNTWVSGALAKLTGGPLFAFHHHPLYSCGSHGSSTSMQATFQPMFETNHVTTDFTGHDHDLIVWSNINGVRYVVSGGGGTGLYPLSGCQGPYAQSKYGFMIVTVSGQTINQTLYDENGVQLYSTGAFQAFGAAPDFANIGNLLVY